MIGKRRPFAFDVLLTGIGQLAVAAGRTLYFVIIARVLGPAPLGAVTSVVAVGTLLGLVTAAGTGPAATQQIAVALASGTPGYAHRVYAWSARLSVWLLAAAAGVSAALYALVASDTWTAINLAGFTLAYGGYQFQRSVDYGFGRVAAYAKTEILANVVTVAAAPAVLLGNTFLLLPLAAGYAVFIGFSARRTRRLIRGQPGPRPLADEPVLERAVNSYAVINGLGTLASMASLQLGVVVAHHGIGPYESGLYAAAFALLLPVLYLPRAVGTALLPRAATELVTSRERAWRDLTRITAALALLAVPITVIGCLLAPQLLDAAAGARYAAGASSLRLLLLASMFLTVSVPAVNTLSASGIKGLWIPFWSSMGSVVITGSIWATTLALGYGIQGIAFGVLAGSIIKSIVPMLVAFRSYRVPRSTPGSTEVCLTESVVVGWRG